MRPLATKLDQVSKFYTFVETPGNQARTGDQVIYFLLRPLATKLEQVSKFYTFVETPSNQARTGEQVLYLLNALTATLE